MKRQCHCGDAGDETVFGACRRCNPTAATQTTLPRLVPSWRFVAPESDPHDLEMRANPYDFDDDERRGF